MSNNPIQRVFLDSQFLFAYISEIPKDIEQLYAAEVKAILYNSNPHIQIIISFVAIGETVNSINKKLDQSHLNNAFMNLSAFLNEKRVDMKPPTLEIFKKTLDLIKSDNHLDYTDAMILSHALCDDCSTHFLTGDSTLLESESIQIACREYRKDNRFPNLKIRDSF